MCTPSNVIIGLKLDLLFEYVINGLFNCFCLLHADINECSNSEACSLQVCTNTNGSYICACSPEFILSADMKTCKGYSII